MNEFCEQWLPCEFVTGEKTCCNVQRSHLKGHQASNGKIFAKGEYVAELSAETFFGEWMKMIDTCLNTLNKKVNAMGPDGKEAELVSRVHWQEIKDFLPATDNSPILSHATCFCCVRRVPEHVLPCGHVLCKPCVKSFGVENENGVYELECCPLHPDHTRWQVPACFAFKPPGAGVRVLCLDG